MKAPVSLCMEFTSVAYWMLSDGNDNEVMELALSRASRGSDWADYLGFEWSHGRACTPEEWWDLVRDHVPRGDV